MNELFGRILGNRYKILEKAGEGGMARVYKGIDLKLNRHVAIKVLHQQFAGDPEFLRRFQQEAKAAAKLSHPAIVNVYDEGEQEGIHYIVMEYVDGYTLKDTILRQGRLEPMEATRIALQVCDAIVHAHSQGVIHRDIKPQNILITPEGRIKVTDFGIARATADSTITYGKSLLGSVYYSSPEQVKGNNTDQKSDIYSLGIVLYEMLTGKVPFSGESPVSIALKHLQEEITPPGKIVPDLPPGLEKIVLRSTNKDPALRYDNAIGFRDDLESWFESRNKTIFLNNTYIDKNKSHDFQNGQETKEEEPDKVVRKNKTPRKVVLYTSIFAVVFLMAFLGYNLLCKLLVVPEVTVPDLTGMSLKNAEEELSRCGLDFTIAGEINSDDIPVNHVVSHDPPGDRKVRKERIIELYLSSGPSYIEVPYLLGKTELEARYMLADRGLEISVAEEYNGEVAPGYIVRQSPSSDFQLSAGDTVHIVVSMGKQPFSLRDFQGWSLEDVKEWLNRYELILQNVDEEFSDEFEEGKVISQFPSKGELVRAGDSVTLVVSKGKEPGTSKTYLIPFQPRVAMGQLIRIYVEDEEGTRTVFEGIYGGQVFNVEGTGSGKIVLMEQRDDDYFTIETKIFP
ncbi:MAG: Stk1 family PASTA domain-containing Ser/Thr kinase [Dethiobacteria bacterium]